MIGKYIWYLRNREGLSLEVVSEKSGLTTSVLKEFEDLNLTRIPNSDLLSVAKAFTFKNAVDYFYFLKLNGVDRHFRIYGLGLPRTGTVSLYNLFGKFRSGHEFLQWDTNQNYISFKEDAITRNTFRDFILLRDAAACLEMDSAYFNRYYISILAEEFSDAKFVCLVREPQSWVRSHINYYMDITKEALQSDKIDNGFPFDLPRGDQISRDQLLQNLDENIEVTFKSWAIAIRMIINQTDKLSPERYCFLRTDEISQKTGMLASLAGIAENDLVFEKSHSNKAVYQVDVTKIVDNEMIARYYNLHCKELWESLLLKV